MIPNLLIPIINDKGILIRPFSDFINYVSTHLVPQGSIILFKDNVPKGFTEYTGITPPTGHKYGIKS